MIPFKSMPYAYYNKDIWFIYDALMAKISGKVYCAEAVFTGE